MTANINYKLIIDEKQVLEFFNLIETSKHHFTVCVSARKKYNPLIKLKKMFINRRLIGQMDPQMMLNRLKHYEVAQGLYLDDDGQPLPENCLSLCITDNPCNLKKCRKRIVKKYIDNLFDLIKEEQEQEEENEHNNDNDNDDKNVQSEVSSIIQSCSSKIFLTLDIDTKQPDEIHAIKDYLKQNEISVFYVIETKNGYHAIIKNNTLSREKKKRIYQMKQLFKIDTFDNATSCIPGTSHSGFLSRLVDWNAAVSMCV